MVANNANDPLGNVIAGEDVDDVGDDEVTLVPQGQRRGCQANANDNNNIPDPPPPPPRVALRLGQISQSLNTRPKGALPSDTVVNPKGGNNHVMAVTTRSGRGDDVNASKQKQILDDDVELQEDEVPLIVQDVVEENMNNEVRIDIQDVEVETQNDKNDNQFKKFIDMMKSLSINVPLVEAVEKMPSYAKFMKDLVIKKHSIDCKTIKMAHQVSAIVHSMAPKLEDPVFKTLGIGKPRSTSMRLQIADRSMKRPLGIIDDVLFCVDKFILPSNFVMLDYEVPIILGRPFLATGKTLVDVEAGELTFRVGDEKDPLEAVLLNPDVNKDASRVEYANSLHDMGSYSYEPRKLSLDLGNRKTPPTKPSIEERPVLELKPLPTHLRYEFLGSNSTLPAILSSYLTNMQVDAILAVL
ncbi:uncharacterized protein [Nicotiana sylvestris]|uniref:uncharacterized protein n=1 Tax=Nicotiana sylvestris TaxID=4096 RepID=UPI00388C4BF5